MFKLMTNIGDKYYEFLNKESEKKNKTKRRILEEALDSYKREMRRDAIRAGYKNAYDEEYKKECLEFAEMGMKDALKHLDD